MDNRAPPRVMLLAHLSGRRPPEITALRRLFKVRMDTGWFFDTVGRVMPDKMAELRAIDDPHEQIARFAETFEHRYFPLAEHVMSWITEGTEYAEEEGDDTVWSLLSGGPPYELYGFEYEDPHEMWQEAGPARTLLLLLLGPDPDLPHAGHFDSGVRVSWFEQATAFMDLTPLTRIPEPPWPGSQVIEALEAEGLNAVATTCRWLSHATDIWMADTHVLPDSWGDPSIYDDGWGDEFLEEMAEQWQVTRVIQEEIRTATAWIEMDPVDAMTTMIDAIEKHNGRPAANRQVQEIPE